MAIGRDSWTHGLWAETAVGAPVAKLFSGKHAADTVVVGAGYTGLTAALFLAEAGKSVCLLDRHEPGWGCSGRNGGQVNPGWKIDPEEIVSLYGPERGTRIQELALDSADLVFDLIEKHGIDCDAVRPGYVQGGHGRRADTLLKERARQWQATARDVKFLGRNACADLLGTETYDCAVWFASGGNLQPLSYARGLASAAADAGADVFSGAQVKSIQPQGNDWKVEAGGGEVTARHVIIGTNGYTDGFWPGLKSAVVPVCSVIAATEPLPTAILEQVLPGRHAVSETRPLMVYYKLDGEGRFVIGGRGPVYQGLDKAGDEEVRRRAIEYFPVLKDVQWTHRWGGHVAMTWDHVPKLMQLAPNVLAGMGYNGRGVAMATVMGRQLALHVLQEDAVLPVSEPYRTPMHAFHKIGLVGHGLAAQVIDRLTTSRGR